MLDRTEWLDRAVRRLPRVTVTTQAAVLSAGPAFIPWRWPSSSQLSFKDPSGTAQWLQLSRLRSRRLLALRFLSRAVMRFRTVHQLQRSAGGRVLLRLPGFKLSVCLLCSNG